MRIFDWRHIIAEGVKTINVYFKRRTESDIFFARHFVEITCCRVVSNSPLRHTTKASFSSLSQNKYVASEQLATTTQRSDSLYSIHHTTFPCYNLHLLSSISLQLVSFLDVDAARTWKSDVLSRICVSSSQAIDLFDSMTSWFASNSNK